MPLVQVKVIEGVFSRPAYYDGFRTAIPMNPGHPFRSIPDSHSD